MSPGLPEVVGDVDLLPAVGTGVYDLTYLTGSRAPVLRERSVANLAASLASSEPSVASSSLSYDTIERCIYQLAPFLCVASPVSSGWEWSVRKMWTLVDQGEYQV
jgi:hypothetical protein